MQEDNLVQMEELLLAQQAIANAYVCLDLADQTVMWQMLVSQDLVTNHAKMVELQWVCQVTANVIVQLAIQELIVSRLYHARMDQMDSLVEMEE